MRVYIANKPMLQTQLNHKKELSTQKKAGEGEKENKEQMGQIEHKQ